MIGSTVRLWCQCHRPRRRVMPTTMTVWPRFAPRFLAQFALDVRKLVVQTQSTDAAHESDHRPSVEELLALYEIDEVLTAPPPTRIAIIDDVLTAGTHYRAMHIKLAERFPGVPLVGMFIARRVFPQIDLAEFLEEL